MLRVWMFSTLWLLAFSLAAAPRILLTEDELAWVEAHPVIRVGVEQQGSPPFDVMDPQGRHTGTSGDYLTLVGERLGVRFLPVIVDSWVGALADWKLAGWMCCPRLRLPRNGCRACHSPAPI
ncbi:transporter substrate-binding domain-containing protein [Pseudomonas sp. MS19]|uniref:transporter substrate-binding domain-containing protein n=1 Tax=Pseudomonas sp. MS19 TaxID=2579939 RepID=UPI0015626B3B|nr:transporter substrate-binding domain-containing protein [Pseudomonas sp. MS19]